MNTIAERYKILKNATVLIVEDNSSELEELSELIDIYCKKCFVAKDGKEGYKKYLKYHPDIILSDYKMPVVNGLEMIEKIRDIDKKVPILLLTIYNDNELFLKAMEYKVSGYIAKPTNSSLILDAILKEYQSLLKDKKIEDKNRLMQAILEEFPHQIMLTDLDGNILFANNTIKKNRFWREDASQKCYEVLYGFEEKCSKKGLGCDSNKALQTGKPQETLHEIVDKNGNKVYTSIKTIPIMDSSQKPYAFLKIAEDKTKEIAHQIHLKHLANHDALTGLPNRILLLDRLKQSILRNKRYGESFVVMFIDLDGFKMINDRYGHKNGDQLLKMVSNRIKNCVRKVDTVSRYGGDEFIVVLDGLKDNNSIKNIAKNILKELNDEFHLEGDIKVKISCSIGIEVFDPKKDEISEEMVIRNADRAMYEVKKSGKNGYKFFALDMI